MSIVGLFQLQYLSSAKGGYWVALRCIEILQKFTPNHLLLRASFGQKKGNLFVSFCFHLTKLFHVLAVTVTITLGSVFVLSRLEWKQNWCLYLRYPTVWWSDDFFWFSHRPIVVLLLQNQHILPVRNNCWITNQNKSQSDCKQSVFVYFMKS